MRIVWVIATVAATACGGRLAALDEGSPDGALEAGVDSAPDAAPDDGFAFDAESPAACYPRGKNGCPYPSYCALWIAADSGAPVNGERPPPESDVLRAACMVGPPTSACPGGMLLTTGYSPYSNQLSWVCCVE
jgi:hypothetical protein